MTPTKKKAAKSKKGAAKKPVEKKSAMPNEAVIFAFRLSPADRDLIHKAAGPAKASKFVLGAALAAANADTKAFNTLVEQAKANLK